jgi:hypothetical protein
MIIKRSSKILVAEYLTILKGCPTSVNRLPLSGDWCRSVGLPNLDIHSPELLLTDSVPDKPWHLSKSGFYKERLNLKSVNPGNIRISVHCV